MKKIITEEDITSFIDLIKLRHEETQFRRIPLEAENHLLDIIRQGAYHQFHIPPFDKMDSNLGLIASDTVTSYKYITISAITLFSRTAIHCGVNADDAFDLADTLLYALSGSQSEEEIHNIFQYSLDLFARQVKELTEHSYKIEQVQTYISRNIFQKITVSEIAEYVQLTPNYLSHMFAQEMGLSIHSYIQKEKVTIACNLLMHTDRPVSDIATYLGFQSQSNFTVIFRKWEKMTPTQYREAMYKEVY